MRMAAITPTSFQGLKPIYVPPKSKKNLSRKFIYNDVLNIVRRLNVPATFTNKRIELPAPTKDLIDELKKLGISYVTKKKPIH